jgi:hypothetical protein
MMTDESRWATRPRARPAPLPVPMRIAAPGAAASPQERMGIFGKLAPRQHDHSLISRHIRKIAVNSRSAATRLAVEQGLL